MMFPLKRSVLNSPNRIFYNSLVVMKLVFETKVHQFFVYKFAQLNLRAQGEHLAIQISREAARLLANMFALST